MSKKKLTPEEAAIAKTFEHCITRVDEILNQRRLSFVVNNVLIPAVLIAMVSALIGSSYPDGFGWLPGLVIEVCLIALFLGGAFACVSVAKCHGSLVRNGSLMRAIVTGKYNRGKVNYGGVSYCYFWSNLLWIFAVVVTWFYIYDYHPVWIFIAPGVVFSVALPCFHNVHARATLSSEKDYHMLTRDLPTGVTTKELRGTAVGADRIVRHAAVSLRNTSSDIGIIATVSIALFVAVLTFIANFGSLNADLKDSTGSTPHKKIGEDEKRQEQTLTTGARAPSPTHDSPSESLELAHDLVPGLVVVLILSLLLSANMLIRLRRAICDYSRKVPRRGFELDELEDHKRRRWHCLEQPFMLYLVVVCLMALGVSFLTIFDRVSFEHCKVAALGISLFLVILYWWSTVKRIRRNESSEFDFWTAGF